MMSAALEIGAVGVQIAALAGLVEARQASALAQSKPATFDEWIVRVMGAGIADLFMRPYNFKARTLPPCHISYRMLPLQATTR